MAAAAIPVLENLAIDAALTGPQGLVIAGGLVLVAGVLYYVQKGDKVKEKTVTTEQEKEKFEPCCCGMMHCPGARGPSGKFKLHFHMKKSRKEAEEAAKHYPGADGALHHATNVVDKYPHFHPTRKGAKIPGVHFQYPG